MFHINKTVGNFNYYIDADEIVISLLNFTDSRYCIAFKGIEELKDLKYLLRSAITDVMKFEKEKRNNSKIKQVNLFTDKEKK